MVSRLVLSNCTFKHGGVSDTVIRSLYNDCLHVERRSLLNKKSANDGYAIIRNRIHLSIIDFFKEICANSKLVFQNSYSLECKSGDSLTNEWSNGLLQEEFRGRNTLSLIKHGRYAPDKLIRTGVDMVAELIKSPDIYTLCEQLIGLNSGYRLEIIFATLMYSFPGSQELTHAEHAMNYHVDYHGPTFCKMFIPITPFDDLHGSHSFIKTSNTVKPRSYQMRQKDVSLLINCYRTSLFVDHKASPGDLIIENTNGYHRGTTGKNPRILLSITVGLVMGK